MYGNPELEPPLIDRAAYTFCVLEALWRALRRRDVYAHGVDDTTGATWLNVVSDRVMGLGGLVVPGTIRDSLFILDAIHNLDVQQRPEMVITDTASYSDIVFGLFAICGYQFAARIADITDTRLWWINTTASYGTLDQLPRHTVRLARVREKWDDMLRVAGSLTTGKARAYDLIRMMSFDGRTTSLGEAFAHYGRIFKTLHLLQFLHDESYRRMIGVQLNVTEARHSLARRIFFGNLGELRQAYQPGWKTNCPRWAWALTPSCGGTPCISMPRSHSYRPPE